jgi:hypothetical protein
MTAEPDPADDREEVRRKFREALDRKQGRTADQAADGDAKKASKIHDAHGPAHTQRQFRRKSGG